MPASIIGEVGHLLGVALIHDTTTRLVCPSRSSLRAVRALGGNGETPYVCTTCGHSWS
ncbi:hypothetical protein [Streptomyces thermogriseus]|uniref:hypothetical protein n=1 Tax=Streptomyces thermogriseus TaxID=75292 RepID=UPI000ACBEDEF